MSDLIDRQAAIDALTRTMVSIPTAGGKDLMDDVNRIRAEDISVIKRLPSAQPEPIRLHVDHAFTEEEIKNLKQKISDSPIVFIPSAEKPFKLPEIYVTDGYDTVADEDGNVGFGVYVPDENQIYVAGDVEDEIRAKALLHELCHWVQAMCGRSFDEDEANEFSDIVYDALPSAQPECAKDFVMLKVIDLNGRPYYSIIYLENGNEFEGYSSYDLKVISEYLKRYFGFAQPEDIQKIQNIEQAQLDKIRELAYQEGKADAMRWIPCSERLPEHGGRYLISVLDGINRRTTVAPYMPRCKAWTMTGRMTYWKVIAWMPLPEPPKEDDHETN